MATPIPKTTLNRIMPPALQRNATFRFAYMPLGESLLLQPVAKTETRTTKLYKERAAEAIARQIVALAEAAGLSTFKLGPDSRLRWTDPSRSPTLEDRQMLLYFTGTYTHQVPHYGPKKQQKRKFTRPKKSRSNHAPNCAGAAD